MYRDIPTELRRLIEPAVEERGFELMDVEMMGAKGQRVLRVTVDTPSGDGRVPVDLLAGISREVAFALDSEDAIEGAYRLEVSSPGLDRMLAREKDFAAACGSEVKVKTRRPVDGRRRFKGKLVDFEAGVARIAVDGAECAVRFADVEKANIVYSFSSADFNGERSDRASE